MCVCHKAHRVYSISFLLIKISLNPTIMLIMIYIQINRNVERIEKLKYNIGVT